MVDNRNPRRQPLRYEVRVHTTLSNGTALNTLHTRVSKLDNAVLAIVEIAKAWAKNSASLRPGTTVSLVDTSDGGVMMTLAWFGHDPNTIDAALNALRANGFQLQEVTSGEG